METAQGATIQARRSVGERTASSPKRSARSQRNFVVDAKNEQVKFVSTKKDGRGKAIYNGGDRVELHSKKKIEEARRLNSEFFKTRLLGSSWNKDKTAYDYELSKFNDLIVKIVKQEDRSEVVRQYPTEGQITYKNAFRKFMELIGL